jgi:GTPase SAR1 family protein
MTIERISEEIDVDNEDETQEQYHAGVKDLEQLNKQTFDDVNQFLGDGLRSAENYDPPWYYRPLAIWSVKKYITAAGWNIAAVLGYGKADPVYYNVQINISESESCVADGQYLLEKEGVRLVIKVSFDVPLNNLVQAETGAAHEPVVKQLLAGIADYQNTHNFYRGKKISFTDKILFLKPGHRDWNSVILDPVMKKEIRQNTVGFLQKCRQLGRYGIPSLRGIILTAEPGTGKTTIIKALMSEAENITCITTSAYGFLREGYVAELFAIAQYLNPTIVFIEDIDFIGQERQQFFRGTPALLELLEEMDGIEEKKGVVVVATTNNIDALDKALSERPSRFDRVFRIGPLNYQQRSELIQNLAKINPFSKEIMEYIVKNTSGFTPAQLQEVVYGMIISQTVGGQETVDFTRGDVDSTISMINYRKMGRIGFSVFSDHS